MTLSPALIVLATSLVSHEAAASETGSGAIHILQQPTDQKAWPGSDVSFLVAVVEEGLQYQWRHNGIDLPGQTSAELSLLNVGPEDAGAYAVLISTGVESLLSSEARLSVAPVAGWGANDSGQSKPPEGLSQIVGIAAGESHSLAVDREGKVYAWGDNAARECNVPAGLGRVISVAAGQRCSLALQENGRVFSWGTPEYSLVPAPTRLTNAVAVSARSVHALALRADGTVFAWGYNAFGQTRVPAVLTNVIAVAAGGNHSLALTADGRVVAWGANDYGQSRVPADLGDVIAIAAGLNHSLALRADRTVIAWGDNRNNQSNVPATVSNVVAITAAAFQSFALLADGEIESWGGNDSGLQVAPAGLTKAAALSGGTMHAVALIGEGAPVFPPGITNRTIAPGLPMTLYLPAIGAAPISYQWQRNGDDLPNQTNALLQIRSEQPGEVGVFTLRASNRYGASAQSFVVTTEPVVILQAPASQTVWPGAAVRFAVLAKGDQLQYQWRFNGTDLPGQTGPELVISNAGWADAGTYAVLVHNTVGSVTSTEARLALSTVVAWGQNSSGQTDVAQGLSNVVAVAASDGHTVALGRDGRVTASGDNTFHQCSIPSGLTEVTAIGAAGDKTLTVQRDGLIRVWTSYSWNRAIPTALTNAIALSIGNLGSLALTADGRVFAWDPESYGSSSILRGPNEAVAIATGFRHRLALSASGEVFGWGANDLGQSTIPEGLNDAVAIAAGASHSVALTSDHTVRAWGDNSRGQINVPSDLHDVIAIAAGASHSIALKADGTVVAWGADDFGQASVPSGLSNVVAIAAGGQFSVAIVGEGRPFFGAGLTNRVVAAGSPMHIYAPAVGASPISYQWQFKGADLPAETNASLQIAAIQMNQSGAYTLQARNSSGIAFQVFNLTVAPAVIVEQPGTTHAPFGSEVRLSVTAKGEGLQYQWRHNGLDVPAATSPELLLTDASLDDAGRYQVIITGPAGSIASDEASVVISSVLGWGSNSFGQRNAPSGLGAVAEVAAGAGHTLALRTDGKVLGWGDDIYGQSTAPEGLSNVVRIACGANHSLALKSDGTVTAWGNNRHGQTDVPSDLTDVVAIAGGAHHSIALSQSGQIRAWGWKAFGLTSVPVGLTDVVAIAAGSYHSVALTRAGTVLSWGSNGSGQTNAPASLSNVIAIAAGAFHNLALRADGTVAAWGSNSVGQASVPSGLSNVTAIACGGDQSIALQQNGTIVCWGEGGVNSIVTAGSAPPRGIAAGQRHGLAWFDSPDLGATLELAATNSDSQASPPAGSMDWNPNATGGANFPPLPVLPGRRGTVTCAEYPRVSYDLYLPPDYSTNGPPLPVLITFNPNGGGMVSDFTSVASDLGVILIGIVQAQNGQPVQSRIDVLDAVSRDLRLRLHYNPAAVFGGGVSGGGWCGYDLAKIFRPLVAGVLPVVGWLGNQYSPTDRFSPGLLVARATGTSDSSSKYYLRPDGNYLQSYGAVVRDWTFAGGHEMASVPVRRECLAWLIDQCRPARPQDKHEAELQISAWREAVAAGDGARVLRECVQSLLTKPRTYQAHYAQIMLDELLADFDLFRTIDVSDLAVGKDAQDLFFFTAFGAGRLALKSSPADRYYSSLKALTGITGASDLRHDDIIWCLQTYGYPLTLRARPRSNRELRLTLERAVPLLDYSLQTAPSLESAAWEQVDLTINPDGNESLVLPLSDESTRFFKLKGTPLPKLGLPEDSTGPGNISQ